jgi:hypothetical protein
VSGGVFQNALTAKIVEFLLSIGIEVLPAELREETFLPGIFVEGGKLLVDESRLTYPGDILHEAGHLAVAPKELRPSLSGEVIIEGADMNVVEMAVTAWAYAAVIHLGLTPETLFHEGGYKGRSQSLLLTFGAGVFPGVGGLKAIGMTVLAEEAERTGVKPYPHMMKWVRD